MAADGNWVTQAPCARRAGGLPSCCHAQAFPRESRPVPEGRACAHACASGRRAGKRDAGHGAWWVNNAIWMALYSLPSTEYT